MGMGLFRAEKSVNSVRVGDHLQHEFRRARGRGKHQCRPKLCEHAGWGTQQGADGTKPGIMVNKAMLQSCRRERPSLCHVPWTPWGSCPGNLSQISPTYQPLPSLAIQPSPEEWPWLHGPLCPTPELRDTQLHHHYYLEGNHFPTHLYYTHVP